MIYENQARYYQVLSEVNKANDVTLFIEFMLELILKAVKEYHGEKHKFPELADDFTVQEQEAFYAISEYLFDNQVITTTTASMITGKSLPTTRRYLVRFAAEGLLDATGENKNRKYYIREQ